MPVNAPGPDKHDPTPRVVKGTSPILAVVVWLGFAGLWLGVVGLITSIAWDKVRRETGLQIFIAVFWAAGLFLAAMGVRAILHARRFGSSSLALDAAPAR